MRPRAALCHGLLGAVWFVATIFATDAHAGTEETEETEGTVEYEFSGLLSAKKKIATRCDRTGKAMLVKSISRRR